MSPQILYTLNQRYTQGCGLGQQAIMREGSGDIAGAAQLFGQSATAIMNAIMMAQQSGIPVMDRVFFACCYSHFNASRTQILLGWLPGVAEHLTLAQVALNQALVLNPNYFQYHSAAGVILLVQGDLPGSIPAFQRAVQLNPSDPWSQYVLGVVNAAQGNVLVGNQCFRAAVQNAPLLPPPQQVLRSLQGAAPQDASPQRFDGNQMLKTLAEVARCVNNVGGLFGNMQTTRAAGAGSSDWSARSSETWASY